MCSVTFYKNNNFEGDLEIFSSAQAVTDLKGFSKKSDSLKTDNDAWVVAFNGTNYKGNFLQIEPGSNLNDLNHTDRSPKGDWKDQIQSFIMYDSKPPFWDAGFPRPCIDNNKLASLFPHSYLDDNDMAIAYEVQDSTYRIHCPVFSGQDLTSVTYSLSLDHENAASIDDHASFLAVFDNSGVLLDIKSFNWKCGGAFNINADVVSDIEDGIDFLADLTDSFTGGGSTEIAKTFDRIFSLSCKVFNFAAAQIYRFTDNGGMYYFLPVICHTINRLSLSATTAVPESGIIVIPE